MSSTSRPSPHPVTHPDFLRHIISHASTSTLASALRVHSTWYDLAIPLLYRDITLDLNAASHAFEGALVLAPWSSWSILADGRKVEALKHTEVLRIRNHEHEKPFEDWTYRPIRLPKVKTIFFFEAGQMCDLIECPCFTLARPREIIRVTTSTAGTATAHRKACNEAFYLPLPNVWAKVDRFVILLQHHGKTCGELTDDDAPRLHLVRMIVYDTAARCILVDNGQYGDLMGLCKFKDAGQMRRLYGGTSLATTNSQQIQWMTSKDYFESEGADGGLSAEEWEQYSEVTW